VPKEAVSTLPKKEVERQSVFFEIVKSEREYVTDLGLMEDESTSYSEQPHFLSENGRLSLHMSLFRDY
jgi:hypothetical protein